MAEGEELFSCTEFSTSMGMGPKKNPGTRRAVEMTIFDPLSIVRFPSHSTKNEQYLDDPGSS